MTTLKKRLMNNMGQRATQIDEFHGEVTANALFLSRIATALTTVTEEIKSGGTYTATVLEADDYELKFRGRQLRRLVDGTNPRSTWGDTVTVIYVPQDDKERRARMTVDLVKLAVAFNALDSEKIGDYSMKSARYEATRQNILNRLTSWGFA
ncbi:MAG: hypothetical protein ACUZ8A_03760 [Candidatus Bathyanammoxibius sp.]